MAQPTLRDKTFCLLNREMRGIQNLTDSFSGEGEEGQKNFITDLNTTLDTLKNEEGGTNEEEVRDIAEDVVDDRVYDPTSLDPQEDSFYTKGQMEDMFFWKVESVERLPQVPESNTIYLIQGNFVVE